MTHKQKNSLILLRHGQSRWNKANLFTGWVDIPLSTEGIEESIEAGKKIAHIPIDLIFVSSLIRAQMTAMLAMAQHNGPKVPCILHPHQGKLENWAKVYSEEAEKSCIPVITAWELNERMYGRLQGMNKQEMREKYGEEQVKLWRRSYDTAPPDGESLAMTAARALPYFQKQVLPALTSGKNVLISAHGNSLRAIVMFLDNLSKEEVVELEIPTGKPILYSFHEGAWEKHG
jgi:2,3-bisphosphoglycerate-dependent phosphoglycerate mutase